MASAPWRALHVKGDSFYQMHSVRLSKCIFICEDNFAREIDSKRNARAPITAALQLYAYSTALGLVS